MPDEKKIVVGVDEAGRGPLAGDVVSCALYLSKEPPFTPKDSKKISRHVREKNFIWLLDNAEFAVGSASPLEIDRLNILEATFLAFNRAIKGLIEKSEAFKTASFIIDGPHFKTGLDIDYSCVIGADSSVPAVSCASVVAKLVRDQLMNILDYIYPEWDFAVNKGYPTPAHRLKLKKYSLTPFHRRSFAPCKMPAA